MASINLGDEDLMQQDYYGDDMDEDEIPDMPPMIAPLSPIANSGDDVGNQSFGSTGGVLDGLLDEPGENEGGGEAKPKRVVNRKPQPKLDEDRLTGDRGLPILAKHFERIKFKGKGHEAADLNLLMSTMEHWAYRLYPKFTFKNMVQKIEKLGRKQRVKTCILKIRMDMPILDDDFVEGNNNQMDDVLEGDGDIPLGDGDIPRGDGDMPRDNVEVVGEMAESQRGDTEEVETNPTAPNPAASTTLTEEQKIRIEENKRRAMERKAAKDSSQVQDDEMGGLTQEELDDIQGQSAAVHENVRSDELETMSEMEQLLEDEKPPAENEMEATANNIVYESDKNTQVKEDGVSLTDTNEVVGPDKNTIEVKEDGVSTAYTNEIVGPDKELTATDSAKNFSESDKNTISLADTNEIVGPDDTATDDTESKI